MSQEKSCPDCGGKLGILSMFGPNAVAFCLADCYEKKPEVEL